MSSNYEIFAEWITKKIKNDFRFIKQYIQEKSRTIKPFDTPIQINKWSNNINLCWIGHSTVLINFKGIKIITDPVFSDKVGVSILGLHKIGPKRFIEPALKFEKLPDIDLLLVSHAHMDHLDKQTLKKFDNSIPMITSKNTKDLLPYKNNIRELDWEEKMKFEKGHTKVTIKAFKVKHPGARMRFDRHRKSNGYIISDATFSIIFLGDTAYSHHFSNLKEATKYDLLLAPIGAYNPWITKHCNPKQALKIADMIGCKYVLPIHHSTFKLSNESMDEPIQLFSRTTSQAIKIPWKIGDELEFKA